MTDEMYILVQLNNLTARPTISKLISRLRYLILVFSVCYSNLKQSFISRMLR